MSDERFNQLINDLLQRQTGPMAIGRVLLALRYVVDSCGNLGEAALALYCDLREREDTEMEEFDS